VASSVYDLIIARESLFKAISESIVTAIYLLAELPYIVFKAPYKNVSKSEVVKLEPLLIVKVKAV